MEHLFRRGRLLLGRLLLGRLLLGRLLLGWLLLGRLLLGWLLALHTNISPDWKSMPGKNALAFYKKL
jgi:hypothetical protein